MRGERQQQLLHMTADIELASLPRRSPVEQQAAPSHSRYRGGERNVFVQVQNVRRIDQRGDKHRRRAVAAEVVQGRTPRPCSYRPIGTRVEPWRLLISCETFQRRTRRLRIALSDRPYHFEKQRKRPRRASMLQCTLIRE